MNKLFDGNHPFVRRCTAALTHPVTVGALGLLLLNDLVFKSLWANPWTTGKLSDLAWVVFASPLLAFLLSPLVRKGPLAERIAFVTAYAGLPVLYAAFNTFPVVHDAILWGLSFAGGTGPGAPLDPTDSLVIPFGLAVAIWVWRREPPVSNSLRMRFGLLTAGVAALASVASTPGEPVVGVGVIAVEVKRDGTIVRVRDESPTQSVVTPRGNYTIEGPHIVRVHDGERTVAYSTAFLQEASNIDFQTWLTRRYGLRKIATEPYSITYDENSGNVIAAMGLQGAVVGTPDGQWTQVAVEQYEPIDFSFEAKLLLLSDWQFWLPALALSFSLAGLSMVSPEPGAHETRRSTRIISIIAIIASLFGILFSVAISTSDASGLIEEDILLTWLLTLIWLLGSTIGLILALAVILRSFVDLWSRISLYQRTRPKDSSAARDRMGLLLSIMSSLTGMLALNFLLLLLWVQMGLDLVLARVSAVVFVALVAFILHRYIASMVRRNPLH